MRGQKDEEEEVEEEWKKRCSREESKVQSTYNQLDLLLVLSVSVLEGWNEKGRGGKADLINNALEGPFSGRENGGLGGGKTGDDETQAETHHAASLPFGG